VKRYDIIVCGGGTAGACAAIAAGRRGRSVLVIEQLGFLGGSQTGALVLPYMNYQVPTQQLIAGLHQEIIDRLAAWPGGARTSFFNYELLKYVLEEMVLEAGVQVRYHTFLADAIVSASRLTGVVTYSKSGREEFAAAQVVDCTGDADVAYRAGAPCESGRPEDGLNQSASLRFVLGNVDLDVLSGLLTELGVPSAPPELTMGFARGYTQAPQVEALLDQAIAEGCLTADEAGYFQIFSIPGRPGEVAFNCPRVTHINGARADDLTRVQVEGRKIIPKLMDFCRRYLRGFADCYLLTTAVLPGIRESRRIVGEYVLTADDCLEPTRFPDRVAKSCYMIDIHDPTGVGVATRHLPPGEYHDLPYRCLVPLAVDGLLVAGRCISTTFEAQAAIRIEPTCRALGEAAGTAAALCVEQGCTPRELPPESLLAALAEAGANVSP
jgi:hypothetical protein